MCSSDLPRAAGPVLVPDQPVMRMFSDAGFAWGADTQRIAHRAARSVLHALYIKGSIGTLLVQFSVLGATALRGYCCCERTSTADTGSRDFSIDRLHPGQRFGWSYPIWA